MLKKIIPAALFLLTLTSATPVFADLVTDSIFLSPPTFIYGICAIIVIAGIILLVRTIKANARKNKGE